MSFDSRRILLSTHCGNEFDRPALDDMVAMRQHRRQPDEAYTASVRYTIVASVRIRYHGAILPLVWTILQSLRGGRNHGK